MYMDEKTVKRVSKLLNSAYSNWRWDQIKRGEPSSKASQSAFSRLLGVPNTSFSQWVNGTRLPVGGNIDKLANNKYIGPQLYTALGVPQRVPTDPDFQIIAEGWHKLSDEQRQALASYCKEIIDSARNDSRPISKTRSDSSRRQAEGEIAVQIPLDGLDSDLE
jgi:hypothetical protein